MVLELIDTADLLGLVDKPIAPDGLSLVFWICPVQSSSALFVFVWGRTRKSGERNASTVFNRRVHTALALPSVRRWLQEHICTHVELEHQQRK